ncbi:hypothetical protein [Psychrobacter sp. AOP29-E1-7]|uniref:hypothetical protein n=1 Tax=Psychrobacter sp. AOP29-E1-7 TaxID=3457702 RepID=UPI004036817D
MTSLRLVISPLATMLFKPSVMTSRASLVARGKLSRCAINRLRMGSFGSDKS